MAWHLLLISRGRKSRARNRSFFPVRASPCPSKLGLAEGRRPELGLARGRGALRAQRRQRRRASHSSAAGHWGQRGIRVSSCRAHLAAGRAWPAAGRAQTATLVTVTSVARAAEAAVGHRRPGPQAPALCAGCAAHRGRRIAGRLRIDTCITPAGRPAGLIRTPVTGEKVWLRGGHSGPWPGPVAPATALRDTGG